MVDINIVTVSGRLGADPESKGNDQTDIAQFRLCCNGRRKQGDEWVDVPNWISFTAFGWQAKRMLEQAKKGDEIVVQGKIREEHWEVNGEKKTRISIIADNCKVVARAQAAQQTMSSETPF